MSGVFVQSRPLGVMKMDEAYIMQILLVHFGSAGKGYWFWF
ncbi:hypothetical protein BVRB_3g067940 [Beta vulgaris subsp. vulgaris]|uniref:Uncharacterized protein n=1 Tax=Beta vulgaris subsp. vulgaris TaxID=3555 RepID=A0A0J8BC04_BETVV|nr:hypothetical protein BVRB_3g067940 [Beta vulgaris subsp. vulgaris]